MFKRDLYYKIVDSLKTSKVTFVLGPRKCGKTFALRQVRDNYVNVEFIDFKQVLKDESMQIIKRIESDILCGVDMLYLLDEVTYIFFPF